jgi:hypothetical protein
LNSHGRIAYEIEDESGLPGVNYYRLSQTDTDGTLTVYNDYWIRYTSCTSKVPNYVYPMPAKEYFILENKSDNNLSYQITDMQGNILRKGTLVTGDNKILIADFRPGLYCLRTIVGEIYKIIKE